MNRSRYLWTQWGVLLVLALCTVTADARPRRARAKIRVAPTAKAVPPNVIQAKAYILVDVSSGRILVEHNGRQRMFPASTTKTMTALVALKRGNLDSVVRVGPNPPKTGEQSVYLLEGEQFLLRDLVQAAMIKSANDSCVAIAEGVAGTVSQFARMMNEEAKKAGARNTNFVNPHGLHHPNHYTTAHDLSLITRAAMSYPFFNQITKTRSATIHGNYKIGPERLLVNRNKLLFRWPESDGVKTGYTKQAGRCLIAAATRIDPASGKPWRLLSVVLHSPDVWSDSQKLLMRHGFEQFKPVVMARADEAVAPADIRGGASVTKAVTAHDVLLPLRRSEQATLTQRVRLLRLVAPIAKGSAVGSLEFEAQGRKIAEVPLVAQEAVAASLVARVVPPAAFLVPSNPSWRYLLYGAILLAIALALSIRKVRANERGKTKRRQIAQTQAAARPGPPTSARPSASPGGRPARRAAPGDAEIIPPVRRPPLVRQSGTGRPGTDQPGSVRRSEPAPTTTTPATTAPTAASGGIDYAARRRIFEERIAARQRAEQEAAAARPINRSAARRPDSAPGQS